MYNLPWIITCGKTYIASYNLDSSHSASQGTAVDWTGTETTGIAGGGGATYYDDLTVGTGGYGGNGCVIIYWNTNQ